MKQRIAWVSATSLLDTDIYIVPLLAEKYDIDWFIIRRKGEHHDFEKEIDGLKNTCQIIDFVIGQRFRSIKTLTAFWHLGGIINNRKYAYRYIEFGLMPYFIPVMAIRLDLRTTVLAIHNVHIPNGGNNHLSASVFTQFAIWRFKNFNVFSKSQYDLLCADAPNKNVVYTPFLLKDFGTSKGSREDERITFTLFGNLLPYKRADVLINAAEMAYKKTGISFRVLIAGGCKNWSDYQKLITHTDLFDLRIKRIPNDDIPQLFRETDFYVMPYQDIAQSGAMMVALNYKKPIIASDLEAFRENVIHGQTGFLFEATNVDALANTMIFTLQNYNEIYATLKSNINKMISDKFSKERVLSTYVKMFEALS